MPRMESAMPGRNAVYRNSLFISLIIVLGFLVYSNTFHVPFVFDDVPNIIENPAIRDLSFFSDLSKINNIPMEEGVKNFFKSRYLGYVTFALNYKLHGFNLAGYHFINLVVHIINALLVYYLLMLTFKTPYFSTYYDQNYSRQSYSLVSFFVALFFVAHPIQTQAVTYIVQRFTILATLFYLFSLTAYIQSKLSKSVYVRVAMYGLSFLAALFAMKTKEFSFTLPIAIIFYEFMFFRGNIRKRILYLLPFIMAMSIIPLTLIGQSGSGIDLASITASFDIANNHNISRWDYFVTQLTVIPMYVKLMFPPVIQNLDYDYPIYQSFFQPAVLLSLLAIISLIFLAGYLYHCSRSAGSDSRFIRLISFGIVWFFLTLAVESTIIPIADVIFEHRVYLPSVGFFISAAAVVILVKHRLNTVNASWATLINFAIILVLLILSGATYARNTVWRDEIRLWTDTVNKSPNKARPHNNLGLAYEKKGDLNSALREYKITLKLQPDYEGVHLNIGTIYYRQNLFGDALRYYQEALKLKPEYAKAHNSIGSVYFKQGKIDDALKEYITALTLKPDYAQAHNNIANVYRRQGRFNDALREYQTAVALTPDYAEAHNNLANLYFHLDRLDEALFEYRKVAKLSPDYIGVYVSMGNIHFKLGDFTQAAQEYQTALRYKPDYEEARQNLNTVHRLVQRSKEIQR